MTLTGPSGYLSPNEFPQDGYPLTRTELNSQLAPRLIWRIQRVRVPAPTDATEAEMSRARQSLLSLEDNWDGEGAGPYLPETLDRASSFLRLHNSSLWKHFRERMPVPTIGPGPDGSVDLFWRTDHGTLLVNVPATPNHPASYSGADEHGQRTKGSFDSSRFNLGVIACLMTLLGK